MFTALVEIGATICALYLGAHFLVTWFGHMAIGTHRTCHQRQRIVGVGCGIAFVLTVMVVFGIWAA